MMPRGLSLVFGLALGAIILWDAFETVVLPRTVSRRLRLARLYFRGTWKPFAHIAAMVRSPNRRERFLAVYGPLSLIGLITVWAFGLILAFAAYALGRRFAPGDDGQPERILSTIST